MNGNKTSWWQVLAVVIAFLVSFGSAIAGYSALQERTANIKESFEYKVNRQNLRIDKIETNINTILALQWQIAGKLGIHQATTSGRN